MQPQEFAHVTDQIFADVGEKGIERSYVRWLYLDTLILFTRDNWSIGTKEQRSRAIKLYRLVDDMYEVEVLEGSDDLWWLQLYWRGVQLPGKRSYFWARLSGLILKINPSVTDESLLAWANRPRSRYW